MSFNMESIFDFSANPGLQWASLGELYKDSTKFISSSDSLPILIIYIVMMFYLIGGLNILKTEFLFPCLEDICSIFSDKRLFGLKAFTYVFFMNADQFFYLVFNNITDREAFGLLTFYYSDVLMYSLLFGMTMFKISEFSMNSCMLYRDGLLIMAGLVIHIMYIITKNKDLHFASLGLYVGYLVLDWKNDSCTHMGMKLLGRIKDDDSFEGEIPMKMKRTAKDFRFLYSKIEEIIDEKREKYYTYLKFHRVLVDRTVSMMIAHKPDVQDLSDEEKHEYKQRKTALYMKFGRAVYKCLFLLRFETKTNLVERENFFSNMISFKESNMANRKELGFEPEKSGKQDINFNEEIEELPEEEDGGMSAFERHSVKDPEEPQEKSVQDVDDNKSVRSDAASVAGQSVAEGQVPSEAQPEKKKKRNLHTSNDTKNFKPKGAQAKVRQSVLDWPSTFVGRVVYVIFYPYYVLYWLTMPNILKNPEIIKVLIGILFSFLYFIGFAFVLTSVQQDLIFNFKIKPQILAMFNSIFYSLSFLMYSYDYARKNSSMDGVNFFLTIQEMTIFKFSFLIFLNGVATYITGDLRISLKVETLLIIAFGVIVGIHVIAFFLNLTGLWLKPCMKIPVAAIFMLIYVLFLGLNYYF